MTENRFARLKENFDKDEPQYDVKKQLKSHLIATIKRVASPSRYIMMSVMIS